MSLSIGQPAERHAHRKNPRTGVAAARQRHRSQQLDSNTSGLGFVKAPQAGDTLRLESRPGGLPLIQPSPCQFPLRCSEPASLIVTHHAAIVRRLRLFSQTP